MMNGTGNKLMKLLKEEIDSTFISYDCEFIEASSTKMCV